MRKLFTLFLSICVLFGGCQAFAEENSPDTALSVDYEGVWFPLTEIGFQVFLPYDWSIFDDEEVYLMAGDEDGAQNMWIELIENKEGYTNDSIFSEFSESPQYENVYELNFTNVRLTCFEDAESEMIFGITLSADEAYACFIYFSPNSLLAQQILSTVSLLGENVGGAIN